MESPAVLQRYGRFNLYDIFANFVPGAAFVVGLVMPYTGVDGLVDGLTLGGILLGVLASFVAGLAIQAIAGRFDYGDDDFADHLANVVGEYDADGDAATATDPDIAVNTLDWRFVETARIDFSLSSEFSDWERLYKLVLAELEGTSRRRTLRLQALYLNMRGMAMGAFLLAGWYLLAAFAACMEAVPPALDWWQLFPIAALSGVLGIVFYRRGREFSRDVTKYMMLEYYLAKLDAHREGIDLSYLQDDSTGTK